MNEIKLGSRKYARKCSYILQDDNLYPAFTVYETMLLAANLKIAGISTGEKKIIVSATSYFELSECLNEMNRKKTSKKK